MKESMGNLVPFRVSEKEKQKLTQLADRAEMSVSEFIRYKMFGEVSDNSCPNFFALIQTKNRIVTKRVTKAEYDTILEVLYIFFDDSIVLYKMNESDAVQTILNLYSCANSIANLVPLGLGDWIDYKGDT